MSTVRYLGIEVDDAIEIAEKIDENPLHRATRNSLVQAKDRGIIRSTLWNRKPAM